MELNTHRLGAVVGLFALAFGSTSLFAQEGTDFTGRWVLESETKESDTPIAITVQQSVARTNVRGEPINPFFKDISVVREFASGSRSDTYPMGVVGGTVPGTSVQGGVSPEPYTDLAVKWEGPVLVFETGSHTGRLRQTGEWAERQERWSVDSQRKLRIVVTTRSSAAPPKQVTLVYRRE